MGLMGPPQHCLRYAARNLLPCPNRLLFPYDAGAKSQISLTSFQQQKELAESTGSLCHPPPYSHPPSPARFPSGRPGESLHRGGRTAGRLPAPLPYAPGRGGGKWGHTHIEHRWPGCGCPRGWDARSRDARTRGAQGSECGAENAERGGRSPEPGARSPELRTPNAGLGAQNPERGARRPEPRTRSSERGRPRYAELSAVLRTLTGPGRAGPAPPAAAGKKRGGPAPAGSPGWRRQPRWLLRWREERPRDWLLAADPAPP